MHYEIWDVGTANLIGSFPTEADALAAVRTMIAANGQRSVFAWALASAEPDGCTKELARGRTLATRATTPMTA